MPLPNIYLDAAWRNVTPVCPDRNHLGVGFDIPGTGPVRFALTLADAQWLVASLDDYIKLAAGTQSPMSALIPNSSISVPSDGENV